MLPSSVEDRPQMKSGHRACYMSREFAQQHNFIPKDAAPGFYGFSGYVACRFASFAECIASYSITNLGMWPIKVGEKTVQQQVMLVENAFFPVILGRCVAGSLYLAGSMTPSHRTDPSWRSAACEPTRWTRLWFSSWTVSLSMTGVRL
jgi:hypothetical protein